MKNTRAIAAKIITDVVLKRVSLSKTLEHNFFTHSYTAQQKSFIQQLCYGAARWYFRLNFIVKSLLEKPLKENDTDVHALIILGLYQLMYLRVEQYAAINETVAAARELKKAWAVGLINAVLRNFVRKKNDLIAIADWNKEARIAHPNWLLSALQHAWPIKYQKIALINNEHPLMTLRVNQTKISRDDYHELLTKSNIVAKKLMYNKTAIMLDRPTLVDNLPGFRDGLVTIQDCAAQFAAPLLDLKPGQRVLDACAAPGGKTTHILEVEPNLKELVAIDCDEERIEKVKENLLRLQQNATLICTDVAQTSKWWDKKQFDRILLDAPCSSTGVIRRNPDIKIVRRPKDIDSFEKKQLSLLKAVWPLLKIGGRLVYSTCSLLPRENQLIIQKFLRENNSAEEVAIDQQPWGVSVKFGRQILPQEEMDGFYYVCLAKKQLPSKNR